jgi:hypothetical protein
MLAIYLFIDVIPVTELAEIFTNVEAIERAI